MVYSLGSKFRKSLFDNYTILGVWGFVFVWYTLLLLSPPGSVTAVFHVASNAFNGYNTESPVWMRYVLLSRCYNMVV